MKPTAYQLNQDKLFVKLSIISFVVHTLILFSYNKISWFMHRPLNTEEWSIDVDFMISDISSGSKDTVIPDTKKAEEAVVSERLLPQLTKTFSIENAEQKKEEEETFDETSDPQALSQNKKVEKIQKEDSSLKITAKESSADNKLAVQEALKRLALEKLRQEALVSKQTQTQATGTIARLKDFENSSVSDSGLGLLAIKEYKDKLKAHIGKFWSLPEAYNLKDANLLVVIGIKVDMKGNLNYIEIKKSSSDKMFDEFALNAVKNAAPLPSPPTDKVGEEILLYFTPKSF